MSKTEAASDLPAKSPRNFAIMLRVTAIMLVVLGFIPTASLITDGNPLAWYPDAMRTWLYWTIAVLVVAILLARVAGEAVDRGIARYEHIILRPSAKTFTWLAFAAATLLSLYFGWSLFRLQPIVGDEFAQRFQAHLLAHGRLYANAELPREFFSTIETLDYGGKWFAQFPMGGPFFLAIGELLHAPWLVNPMFTGVSALALYLFASRITDELTARSATLLFVLCPFAFFMGGSQMNHVPALALELIAFAALPRWAAAETTRRSLAMAAIIGAALGVAATIRPFDAAIVGIAIAAFQLHAVVKRGASWRSLIVQVAVGLIPVTLLLIANQITLGQPFMFAYDVLNGREHRPGFHMTPRGFPHTPRRGLFNISAYLLKLNVGLMTWPIPAMLVVAITLLFRKMEDRWDRFQLGIVWLLLAGYTTYWSLSSYLGPRFLFPLAPIFVYYTAQMPQALRARFANTTARRVSALLIPIWLVVAWASPTQDKGIVGVRQLSSLYRSRATGPVIRAAVDTAHLTNALILVPEGWHARLAARLRAITMRPLLAEEIVKDADACAIQTVLTSVDPIAKALPLTALGKVVRTLQADVRGEKVPNQLPSDQLALVRDRQPTLECLGESHSIASDGASIAEMLPYQEFDRQGRMSGNIIYAREFGPRDSVLASKFHDRKWYLVTIEGNGNNRSARLTPAR